MALMNYTTMQITAKIVYYGPGLCGKTSNLQWIHQKTAARSRALRCARLPTKWRRSPAGFGPGNAFVSIASA